VNHLRACQLGEFKLHNIETLLVGELVQRRTRRGRTILAVEEVEIRQALTESPDVVVYLCGAGDEVDVPSAAESASVAHAGK
jgi:hypothetical protein